MRKKEEEERHRRDRKAITFGFNQGDTIFLYFIISFSSFCISSIAY
jgi:hypothetical protein